jgi:manganese transport protein
MSPPPPDASAAVASWNPTAAIPRASSLPARTGPRAATGLWLKQLLRSLGPGYMVAVGYMDPGNWATSLAGGSAYGYSLLWVVLLSSLMGMFLQVLAGRLGIVAGVDLAQACRAHSTQRSAIVQWLLCEAAICACDLAEVIGTAIALNLLFGISLPIGVCLTVFDVLIILCLQKRGFRHLEAVIISLLAIVFGCFILNLLISQPVWTDVLGGLVPSAATVTDPGMLYIAIGIIGATVMPHNLYLHSSLVQNRRHGADDASKRRALHFATIDIVLALAIALLVNAAILIMSAAVFHTRAYDQIEGLQDAWRLLGPLTGSTLASILFALALLASGQSSTLTATLAGQIVMEGYVKLKMAPWVRRLLTRSLAIIPALAVTAIDGESGIARLLLLSQVVLSLQLPFAALPLIRFTSSRAMMGRFASSRLTVITALAIFACIITLDGILIFKALT